MNFGTLLIVLAFALSLISGYYYFSARRDFKAIKIGRLIYKITFGLILFCSLYFLYLILTHQFQYDYIYRYSSRSLPLGYLISSFWAGQEGSYLLWTLFISIMGLMLFRNAKQFESWGMVFVNFAQAFFLLLTIDKSPFELLPAIPADGAGLNPLLQDPWMVIHPPVLFLGYAAITIPFALAMAAFLLKDFNGWLKLALPWTLFSSITLGAGIIIGGFWAYEVLGWGGYWGWDPVENSSLIPWLTILALFHGIIIQKSKNSMIKFNLFLAVISFVLVIYATFLTRSGVLSDFSVHSFQDNGQNIFLTSFMIFILALSAVFFIRSYKNIQSIKLDPFKITRESGIFWSIIALSLSALFVFIGTSSPIITGIFASKASQVDMSFYNKVNFPIVIVIAILLGITPLLLWGVSNLKVLKNRLIISITLAILSAIVAFILGVNKINLLIFILACSFTVWTNLIVIYTQAKLSWFMIGGPLSHFGVGLLFIGIIVSGNFDKNRQIKLTQGETFEALGYNLSYRDAKENPDGKTRINIDIEKNGKIYNKQPKLYFSSYNNSWMREPDITIFPLQDLYISVLEREQVGNQASDRLIIKRGTKQKFDEYEIEFLAFEFGDHQMTENVTIAAALKVTYKGKEYTIKPSISYVENERSSSLEELPGNNGEKRTVVLSNLNADTKMIELTFGGFSFDTADVSEVILVDFNIKPLMNFVWLGTILLTLGTVIAVIRRTKEGKLDIRNQ